MNPQSSTAGGQGKLGKIKKGFKKMLGGKEGGDQQGTELTDMSNSRNHPTGNAYLPQPGSQPPLPTFQRNVLGRTARHARVDSSGLPAIQDVGNLLHPTGSRRYHHHATVGSCGPHDKPETTPPLPRAWTDEHDRAICFMEGKGVDIAGIATQIKKHYPEMKSIVTSAMIDKRLRQLDQIPEIDYWRRAYGQRKTEATASRQAALFAKNRANLDRMYPNRKENEAPPSLLPAGNLRKSRSRTRIQASNNSLSGLAQSQSGNTLPRSRDSAEPTTPTRSAITPETRRRDAAYRATRSQANLRAGSRSSGQSGRISE